MTAGPRHRVESRWRRCGFAVARVGIASASAVAITATGAGWWAMRHTLNGITVSEALASNDPRSTGAAVNILLIGLDSRKDQHGNDLPPAILDQLHAGDSDAGGYNTNTLILVHLGADNRVTAFSIPRDDYVAVRGIPGYRHIKIKEAYGLAKADAQQKLSDHGVADQQTLETRGREAGRAATLRTVRDLTGVPIDYFAEINLAGFYDLTAALGGVQVCLNHPVYDDYSGADFPAGVQTLNAAQALAFVRQRHGLENGDLDRTHRQQAFLVSVMRQLKSTGTFTDLGKLDGLVIMAQKDIVLSTGWNEQLFRRIGNISSAEVEYRTLPVLRYDSIDGQDVNIVDPAAIRAEVRSAFSGDTVTTTEVAPSHSVVDVLVARSGLTGPIGLKGLSGLTSGVSQQLKRRGYRVGTVGQAAAPLQSTSVHYGVGAATDAADVAALLGLSVAPQADSAVEPSHVRVILGADYDYASGGGSGSGDGYASGDGGSGGGYGSGSGDGVSGGVTGSGGGTTPATADHAVTSAPGGEDTTPATPDQGKPIQGSQIPCVN